MSKAFIFPGQGSQFIGMGADLAAAYPEAKAVFDEVDAALAEKLSAVIFDGPDDALNMTVNTQPALMAVSMAVVRVLEARGLDIAKSAAFVAGHSLGEYSALTAAGALSIADAAKLLRLRGSAMQKAVPIGEGSMAAILGLSLEDVQAIADGHCEVANDNSVGQVVISGSVAGVERAVALASERGAKKAVILPVSAPFHCSLMSPAAEAMRVALAEAQVNVPCVPVVANVTAEATSNPQEIRDLLVRQVTGMVRWVDSVHYMKAQGVTEMVELGAGKVLGGLIKRIDRDIECGAIGTVEQVEAL
jgi:[acyl-carrier-protein] S-malonyltransferase